MDRAASLKSVPGANPTLPPDFARESGIVYVTSDVDIRELDKADHAYKKLVLDMSAKTIDSSLFNTFDCICSRMVGEHVADGRQSHENIHQMLRPGGIALHCFSTLWTLPLAINHLLPHELTQRLIRFAQPWRRGNEEKFKAHYSWSRGPTREMVSRFEGLGYEILQYTGYFGHQYYLKLPWLHHLEQRKSSFLLEHPIPQLCSYATLLLRKPDAV